MGLSTAPAMFSWLTGELNAIVRALGIDAIITYVDDIAVAGGSEADCRSALSVVLDVCQYLGFKVNPDKVTSPAQLSTLLGMRINTTAGAAFLETTPQRLYSVLCDLLWLQALAACPDTRVAGDFFQSLTGRLGYVALTTFGGRLHLGPFHYAAATTAPSGFVRLCDDGGLLTAIEWWVAQISSGAIRGQRVIHFEGALVRFSGAAASHLRVRVASDASGDVGYGAHCEGAALWGAWTAAELNHSIQWKELYPLKRAFQQWGASWRGRLVVLGTDNLGNVFTLNTGTAHGEGARATRSLVCELYALATQFGFEFVAMWVPRELNTVADSISKATSLPAASAAAVAAGCSLA
jgi:hypothetical protein